MLHNSHIIHFYMLQLNQNTQKEVWPGSWGQLYIIEHGRG